MPTLDPQNAVTALRTDIEYVITEYGTARLRHLPMTARGDALIDLAAPRFRDALRQQWHDMRQRL